MTYLEKYQSDNPGQMPTSPTVVNGVYKFVCPSTFGYEPDNYACDEMSSCAACWAREMENT